ncbi:MAG: potassium/proton antiporter [Alphaproteobacteria bacterium]|nr:potassium/proton antiporter [Alphaproteobacteria bacterium]
MTFVSLPILLFALLLCVSILTSLVSLRVGIPLILIFLCVGLIAGAGGFEMLEILRRPKICFFIGSLALALILFDSGFQTEMKNYKLASRPAIILATVGVMATTAFMAPFGKHLLDIGWLPACLLAAVISSTDSAAVFFLLRSQGITLREKIKATLEVESGANDPMAIFLTISCITLIQNQAGNNLASFATLGFMFLGQILIGGGMGYLLGKAIPFCINHVKLETALYPIFVIGLALLGFSVTNILGGSGFLAVYIAGLLAGNSKIQAHSQISKFQQTLTWLSQITMFTCLGVFVTVSGLKEYWLPALILGVALMFIARPLMVWIILSFFGKYSGSEKNFISFVGLRGATSVLLALMPIVYELKYADAFFNIIFVMVLLSLAVQGFFIPTMAKVCHVAVPTSHPDSASASLDLPGLADSSLVLYELTDNSPAVQGKKIPRWALPSLVVRDGFAYFSGSVLKRLQSGDKVYVFLPSSNRRVILDELYGSGANQNQEIASDIFGDFPIAPATTFHDLVNLYGIKVPKYAQDMTIMDFMQNELGDIEVGDRLSLGSMELVVRSLKDGKLTGIGLDIDPSRERSFYTRTRDLSPSFRKKN